jgi:hypothetical protein
VGTRDFGVDGALGQQLVEHGLLGFRGIEQLLVELAPMLRGLPSILAIVLASSPKLL